MTDPEHHVEVTDGGVHGWSTTRLPFEPVGAMKIYRDDLRAALRLMAPQDGRGLVATYGAPDQGVVDVENVLLYNVGSGSYRHLVGGGLAVRRSSSPDELHHLDYRVERVAPPEHAGAVLAEIDALVGAWKTAGQWWKGLRRDVHPYLLPAPGNTQPAPPFALDVELHGTWSGPALAAAVKPMLDGLISALHAHDVAEGTAPRAVVEALLGPDAWPLLVDSSSAVLGPRKLVRTHGAHGVAWNPADDLCTEFTVRPVGGTERRLRAVVRMSR